jgi:hypothetical protein
MLQILKAHGTVTRRGRRVAISDWQQTIAAEDFNFGHLGERRAAGSHSYQSQTMKVSAR